ncbi:flagellar biosynthesis protein FlhA [Calycomorphotria hydatis]|uniref:Flagellar biosynthesis protein FlhA n=1 Tax=Calycomorphotria hydatis TaxID=2528027 RepID=A0A517TEG6_9PLAN|nr:flagellar biosynthesis protein FlhA [Calycomorphotria hydatis]QDT66767.1 Flagellar biosynthesis protein FlhA [Calycomorphotria hydatis]
MGGVRDLLYGGRGLIFPILIVTAIFVIVAPLPAVLMDLLLACNVTIGVVILLTTVYVSRPLEFSVFPAILLGTTLSRLVLNVASTRLILTRGASDGTSAAGGVIEAFGSFVSGENLVVGLILFIILIAIQFLVITKGATRISEVAARFALDGMPGKQMAIDADLNAGLISSEQAKTRREEVASQADFYGAMDGASKFVRGDAIASIVITLINIVGGLYIGMVENGMNVSDAARVFTTLTIGDGLVTQVPGFLISLAAGLIVTRTSSDSNLPKDVVGQLFHHPEAMFLAASFLVALSLTGLPTLPMLSLGAGCAVVGFNLRRGRQTQQEHEQQEAEQQEIQQRPEPKPEDHLLVDPLELELGVGLIRLADPAAGGDLLDRVTRIRHKIAQELGIILPKVRIRDNIRIDQKSYQIKLRDVPVAQGQAYPDARLAIDTGAASGQLPGIQTTEPAFGRPAFWIEPTVVERAELYGYNVVEPSAVLITHLTEIVRDHAAELITRQHVHQLLENLQEHSPKLVDELIPDVLRVSQVHQVLTNLLRERVPVRDLEIILETLGNYADRTKDLTILTEYVRHSLARAICQQYRDNDRVLHCITLDPALEEALSSGFDFGENGLVVKLSPVVAEKVTAAIGQSLTRLVEAGHPPVVICGPQIRAGLKQITRTSLPKLAVLSLNEITRDTNVEAHGHVDASAVQ